MIILPQGKDVFAGQRLTCEEWAFAIFDLESCFTPTLDCTEVVLMMVRCSVELYCFFTKLKFPYLSVASATVLTRLVACISMCILSSLNVEITVTNPEISGPSWIHALLHSISDWRKNLRLRELLVLVQKFIC